MAVEMEWLGLQVHGYANFTSTSGITGFYIEADGRNVASMLLATIIQLFSGIPPTEQHTIDNVLVNFLQKLFAGIKLPVVSVLYTPGFGLTVGFKLELPGVARPISLKFYTTARLDDIGGLFLEFISQLTINNLLEQLSPLDFHVRSREVE